MISSTKTQLTSARFLKIAAVLCLILQSSAHVLVLRYSRTLPGQAYLPSTAVVLSEVLKVMICIVVLVTGKRSEGKPVTSMLSDIFGSKSDYIMMAIPAGIYFIQNNLQYVALTLLDAATFQITNQMKLFTTAILSVMFLNTKLSIVKWISLLFMVFGIILVQLSGSKVEHSQTKVEEQILGLLCVVTASVLSGLAAVWFEYALKGKSVDLYIRNIQLGVFSIVPGLLFAVAESGFFQGYNEWTWLAILIQAVGGLIVAVVVKYTNSIMKGIATSISVILSSVASVFIFNFQIGPQFCLGAAIVLIATYKYVTTVDDMPFEMVPTSELKLNSKETLPN